MKFSPITCTEATPNMDITRLFDVAEPCASRITEPGIAATMVTSRSRMHKALGPSVLHMLLANLYVPGCTVMWLTEASSNCMMSSAVVDAVAIRRRKWICVESVEGGLTGPD